MYVLLIRLRNGDVGTLLVPRPSVPRDASGGHISLVLLKVGDLISTTGRADPKRALTYYDIRRVDDLALRPIRGLKGYVVSAYGRVMGAHFGARTMAIDLGRHVAITMPNNGHPVPEIDPVTGQGIEIWGVDDVRLNVIRDV